MGFFQGVIILLDCHLEKRIRVSGVLLELFGGGSIIILVFLVVFRLELVVFSREIIIGVISFIIILVKVGFWVWSRFLLEKVLERIDI